MFISLNIIVFIPLRDTLYVFVGCSGKGSRSRVVTVGVENTSFDGAAVSDMENRVTAWICRASSHTVLRNVSDGVDRAQGRFLTGLKRVCKLRFVSTSRFEEAHITFHDLLTQNNPQETLVALRISKENLKSAR